MLLDLETKVQELESEGRWPELEERAFDDVAWAAPLIANDGTPAEQKLLDDAIGGLNRARKNRSVKDLERHRRVIRRLGNAAFFRDPQAWVFVFENYASAIHEASNLQRAEALVVEGRKHIKNGEPKLLRGICDQLVELMPVSAQERPAPTRRACAEGHASGSSGMNSFVSPTTRGKRPWRQSSFACSMRSFVLATSSSR